MQTETVVSRCYIVTAIQRAITMLRVPAVESAPQVFPEAINVGKPRCPERREVLVEVSGESVGRSVYGRLARPLHHRIHAGARRSVAVALRCGRPVVVLLQRR